MKNALTNFVSFGMAASVLSFSITAYAGASEQPWTPVTSIDFSARHDVMIQNDDGSLTPMDVPYFKSTLIAPGTWQILADGDYLYLVEGDDEALVIDSGYGAGNIREYCQNLTKKPIKNIVNTHYHFDHTANNAYFDAAYMSAETKAKATIPYPSFAGINFPRDYPVVIIGEGYKFQLGNRELEVFEISNHTEGGIALLDRRERILFTEQAQTPADSSAQKIYVRQRVRPEDRGASATNDYLVKMTYAGCTISYDSRHIND